MSESTKAVGRNMLDEDVCP